MTFRRVYSLLIVLLVMLITGCAIAPRYKGVAQGGNAENKLGIQVDEALQVTAIDLDSAAEKAGVQIGDKLVSLTWILSEAPAEIPATEGSAASVEENAADATAPVPAATPMRPPPGVENKTIAFTDDAGVRELIGYSVPLRLQVIRADRVVELTIIPVPDTGASQTTEAAARY